ncbi:MAG TPA: LacI family DNA-binding transcriptional regulator [Candidatus Brachybacterium merdigallinarum]|nr:LacI family DNA-binding transcriptional regulator [Candidatus Brachybacterium merdigallinarum]
MADKVGVSAATVSMVLRGRADGRASAETQARIRDTARELNYVSNGHAASLRTKKTPTVGFISDRIATTPHAVEIIRAASEAARTFEHTLLMVNTGELPSTELTAVRELRRDGIESVIYASMQHRRVTLPEGLPENLVIVDGFADDHAVPATVPDEAGGVVAAVHHLVDLGHRRIGFLNEDPARAIAAELRLEGYRKALEERGIAVDPDLIEESRNEPGVSDAGVAKLLERARPTAIVCFNDEMATGVYREAGRRGLSIPEDLSVVGFDNLELVATLVDPPLTTVRLPHAEMGEWAIRMLLDERYRDSATTAPGPVLQPAPLVIRSSTGPPGASMRP